MIPASSWGQSLKNILPAELWRKVRQEVLAKSKYKCTICGSRSNLECHEVWKYNDAARTQKLCGFLALCKACHAVKHIGYATLTEGEYRSDINTLVKHFMKVNKCDRLTFEKHYKKAVKIWHQRSRFEWNIIFARYDTAD
jgi:hypothetical protein